MKTMIANPASASRSQRRSQARAKVLTGTLPGVDIAAKAADKPKTSGLQGRKNRRAKKTAKSAAEEKLAHEYAKAKVHIAKLEAAAKQPKKRAAKTAAKKKGKTTMAGRSPAQKAATKKMIAANKAAKGSGESKPKKAKSKGASMSTRALQRRPPGKKKLSFKGGGIKSITITRKNPDLPTVVKAVGGILGGTVVGAAGCIGVGMLVDKLKLGRWGQVAALGAGAVLVGGAAAMVSPFAGAAAMFPMVSEALMIGVGGLQIPVSGVGRFGSEAIDQVRQMSVARVGEVVALGGPRRVAGINGVMQLDGQDAAAQRQIGQLVSMYTRR